MTCLEDCAHQAYRLVEWADSDRPTWAGERIQGISKTDREGFEPSKGLPPYRFSRQTPRKHGLSCRAEVPPNPIRVCYLAKANPAKVFAQS
jgi:hypothetical protein